MKHYNETFIGSTFPDAPYKEVNIKFTRELIDEYIPAIEKLNLKRG